jgi:hypothetical protein
MAIEKTVVLKADMKEALDRLGAVEKSLEDINDTTKKTEESTGSLASGFKGVGLAMKAAGFALIMKLVDNLTDALMKNEQIADGVETIFNSVGVVFKMVSDTLISVGKSVLESTDNFDAMQKVITNLMTLAITPLKLAFNGIKLGIQSLQLTWEKSVFGGKGKDIEKIAELTASIEATKESLKGVVTDAIDSGKAIVTNLGEAVGEIVTIAGKTTEAFKETFEGVTVSSIIEQGKAITETKANYELLALAQQRLVEQYDIEAESQRAIRDDVSRDIAERIAANERLGEVLKEQNIAEQAAVDAQITSLQQRIALEGTSRELTNEIFALETEKIAIVAKVKGFEAEQLTNINGLLQEQRDLEQEVLDKQLEDADKLTAKEKEEADKRKAIGEAEKQAKIAFANAGFNAISQLAGEGTKAAKAAAMASILLNTGVAVVGAIKSAQSMPFPLNLGAIATGVGAVLTGIASAKSLLSKVPGGGPDIPEPDVPDVSDSGEDSGGMGAFETPNLEGINQPTIGSGGSNIQAFVVENDISNAQALQEELDIQATL